MAKYFSEAEAREIRTEAVIRIRETLDRFSDRSNLSWDDNVLWDTASNWFAEKESLLYAIMHSARYQANEPFKLVHDISIPRAFNDEACKEFASLVTIHDRTPELETPTKRIALRSYLTGFSDSVITENDVDNFNFYIRRENYFGNQTAHAPKVGQKVSKHVRKLLTEIGFKFLPKEEYEAIEMPEIWERLVLNERDFAKFADGISPTVFKRKFVLSADPRDYLLMSHGNSWSSCYCINAEDWAGQTYEGQYSVGTWSYMTDGVSLISYIVRDTDTENYADVEKILRQVAMVDLENGVLLNSRLYPQSNDCGSDNVYTEMRNCCQALVSEMMNVPNYWAKTSCIPFEESYNFCGYNDVESFSEMISVTYNKAVTETETDDEGRTIPKMRTKYFGGKAYCPVCGEEMARCSRYVCDTCDNGMHTCCECGCEVSEEDGCEIDGHWYCTDCATYCDHCGVYHLRSESESVWTHYGWETWCKDCVENDAFYCESHDRWESELNFSWETVYGNDNEEVKSCMEGITDIAWCCSDCGNWYMDSVQAYEGDDDMYYCDGCIEYHKADEEEA